MSDYENGYDAAIAACERQVNELAEINSTLIAMLKMARASIAEERKILFECCVNPAGKVDDEATDAIAEYDVILNGIDAAIAKAEQK
jgi:hypothetical protein